MNMNEIKEHINRNLAPNLAVTDNMYSVTNQKHYHIIIYQLHKRIFGIAIAKIVVL